MTQARTHAVLEPPAWATELVSVGITGTNGKTSTTTWLAHALSASPTDAVSITTLGVFLGTEPMPHESSYAGVLVSLEQAKNRGARYVAMEMTSEALAKGYAKAWPCRIGIFTNLTHDHLNTHGSFEHYLASKAQLFVSLPPGGTAVLNAACESYPLLRMVLPAGVRLLSYAVPARGPLQVPDETPFLQVDRVDTTWSGTRVCYTCQDAAFPGELLVPGYGSVFAENGVAALLGAFAAGIDPAVATARLATATVPKGRFERVAEAPDVVIDYAHTPDALERTLATARELTKGRVILVFGAGGDRDKSKRPLLGAAACAAHVVVLTSDNPRGEPSAAIAAEIQAGMGGHPHVETVLDRKAAIERALALATPDDLVLVAGKGHETTQTLAGESVSFSDHDVARAAHPAYR